jgi:type IV secretion system protein VirB10
MSESAVPPVPKVDPETLAIRAKPARAIRFRRGVIVAIAASGSVSLLAVAWVALKPPVFSAAAERPELSEPSHRPATDALNGLPATYGDAPKLGPPLPGDLGRPILQRQREMAKEEDSASDAPAQRAAQERERRLAELKTARESGVLVQGRTTHSAPVDAGPAVLTAPPAAEATAPAIDAYPDPSGQARKAHFVGTMIAPGTSIRMRSRQRRHPTCFPRAASSRPA